MAHRFSLSPLKAGGGHDAAATEALQRVHVPDNDVCGQWDCETIVSTLSNLENHPGVIGGPPRRPKRPASSSAGGGASAGPSQIVLSSKTGLPVGYRTSHAVRREDTVPEARPALGGAGEETEKAKPASRHADETAEEKKARKQAVKAERRESRQLKTETKAVFKQEGKRLEGAKAAQKVSNVSGVHFS